MKSRKDHDATGAGAKSRAEVAATQMARRAARARRQAERAEAAVPSPSSRPLETGAIAFDHAVAGRGRVTSLAVDALRAGSALLAEHLQLSVEAGDKLALVGPNGVGKSTLLRALHEASPLPPQSRLLLPQETSAAEAEAWTTAVCALGREEMGALLSRARLLGLDPERVRSGGPLSPGEVRKGIIADALGRSVAALFLDEPTNHLDLPSVERLESALAAYPGTIVLVTHDARFAAAVGARPWRFPTG